MKTIIRNHNGEITHVHYHGRYFLTSADHLLVQQTTITNAMITKAIEDPLYVLKRLLNDDGDSVETMKLYVMIKNGYDITLYNNKAEPIEITLTKF